MVVLVVFRGGGSKLEVTVQYSTEYWTAPRSAYSTNSSRAATVLYPAIFHIFYNYVQRELTRGRDVQNRSSEVMDMFEMHWTTIPSSTIAGDCGISNL